MRTFSVRLPDPTYDDIASLAEAMDRSKNYVTLRALEIGLASLKADAQPRQVPPPVEPMKAQEDS